MQHILHKSGYNYPKRVDIGHFMYLTLGRGIFATEGELTLTDGNLFSECVSQAIYTNASAK